MNLGFVTIILALIMYYIFSLFFNLIKALVVKRKSAQFPNSPPFDELESNPYYKTLFETIDFDKEVPKRLTGAMTMASLCHELKTDVLASKPGYEKRLIVAESGALIEAISVSVPVEFIWDIFFDLLSGLADTVDVYLFDVGMVDQTVEYITSNKDLAVVRSILLDNKDLLVKDGGVGIILGKDAHGEVHLTDDKDILIYTMDATPFLEILHHYGIEETEPVYVCQVPHFHVSYPDVEKRIASLASDLAVEESIVHKREPDEG